MTLREEHRMEGIKEQGAGRISETKWDKIIGILRKIYNDELHNSCSSASIIRKIKSRKMRWAGHIVLMRQIGFCLEFCGKARGRENTRKN
jgi:hypothetical protein